MSISLEWLINKSKKKVYAVGHAKGIVRGSSTVDRDLTNIENNITTMEATLNTLDTRVKNIASGGGGSTSVVLGVASNVGEVMIPTEGWETDDKGVHLDITNSQIDETVVPVVALSPDSYGVASKCGLKPYCRSFEGYMRIYAESVPTEELEVSLALIGSGDSLPKATANTTGVVKPSTGLMVDNAGALSVDPSTVATTDDLVDEDEALAAVKAILESDN